MAPISLSPAIRAGASTSVSPTARITRTSSKKAASKARAAQARRAVDRRKVDAGGKPDGSDVDDGGRAFQHMRRIGEDGLERAGPLEQALVAIKIEGGRSGGDAARLARIGEAVGKLGHCSGPCMKASWIRPRTNTPPRGAAPLVTPGDDAVALGGERVAEPAKAGNDLIED